MTIYDNVHRRNFMMKKDVTKIFEYLCKKELFKKEDEKNFILVKNLQFWQRKGNPSCCKVD